MESVTHIFTAKPKKWGNSIGIVIPIEVVKSEKIDAKKPLIVTILPQSNLDLKETFGTLRRPKNKTTQQIMDEIDESWDNDW